MYSKFYGLSRKPFELTPDPDLIFLSETHQEALSVLLYGVYNRKGFLQISGNVGTGKSTLVQALIQKLENNVHVCHIPNPNFTVDEFYYYIGAKFGLDEFDGNKAKFILHLAEYLKQCREKDEFALLIIDEAQVLSLELLEEIRLLSNQEYTEFGVLSIFFVGQPELNVLLKHKKMDPLRNRIGVRFNLEPLTLGETVSYIKFRLQKAGRTVLLFSAKAIQKIHAASSGIPRSINILCDNALLAGFAEHRGVIDENIIMDCVKELEQLDVDSAPAESDTIHTEPTSPEPVRKVTDQGKKRVKPSGPKKLAFVLVIICALFLAIMYTAEYWGRYPGAEPLKTWFEEFHPDESILKKIKELFISRKSEAESSSAEKNMIPGKTTASSGNLEEQKSAQKRPIVEKKPTAAPVDESFPADNIRPELIETKENPTKTGHTSTTREEGVAPSVTNIGAVNAAAEKKEIMLNPGVFDNERTISQGGTAAIEGILVKVDANAEPIEIRRYPDETGHVSATREERTVSPVINLGAVNAAAEKNEIGQNHGSAENETIASRKESAAIESHSDTIDTDAGPIEIRQNPNEIRSAGITRPTMSAAGKKNLPVEDVTAEPKITQISGDIRYVSITGQVGGANIRSGPSMRDAILRSVSPGYPLRVINEQGQWSRVEDFKNRKGWIASSLLIENSTAILKREKGYLRKGPSYLVDIVADIDYGAILRVEESQGHWLKVYKKNGNDGWIHIDMVWP